MCLSVSRWAGNARISGCGRQRVVGAAEGCSFASHHPYTTGAGSRFFLGMAGFLSSYWGPLHIATSIALLAVRHYASRDFSAGEAARIWSEFGIHSQLPCISGKYSKNKTEAISANCDFYCIYSRIITIFYRKPWNQITFKNKTKKKHTQKNKRTVVWLLLQIYFHELYIQRSLANYLSISWFLVASCKAKITWFVNTKHSTNCSDNVRMELPWISRLYDRTNSALPGLLTENRAGQRNCSVSLDGSRMSSFCSFHPFSLGDWWSGRKGLYLAWKLWKIFHKIRAT